MNDADIAQYLKRIKITRCTTGLSGLTKLQNNHLENIPFENLDIVVGRKIELDYARLFKKLIINKRGGYCFELNTLYAGLLKHLGFSPKPVLGRVWISNPKATPPRNHLAYLVDLDGRTYLTDVGFGGLVARIPLDINVTTPVRDAGGLVRIVPFSRQQYMIQRETKNGWSDQYSFENSLISKEGILISNYYMSTHPNSHFYYHRFVGRNTKEGSVSLFNQKISTRNGIKPVDKKRVDYGQDWLEIIRKQFGIILDFSEAELVRLFREA